MTTSATASFGIEIADETAPGVMSSTQNLEQLRAKLDSDTFALGQMQKALRNLQGGTSVNIAQFRALKQQIADQKIAIAGAQSKYISLGGTFQKVEKSTVSVTKSLVDAKEGVNTLGQDMLAAGGRVGAMSNSASALATRLGKAGVAGVALLAAAAIIAVHTALAAVVVMFARLAVANSDAYRSEKLNLEALTKIPDWWGRAAGKASMLIETTNSMSQAWGVARATVGQFTSDLYLAGYRGNMLKNAVEATTVAVAAFGGDTEKANRYLGSMSWQFGMLGKGSAAFAARVKRDLGDIAIRQSLGVSKQMVMLRQNLGLLFSGVKIEGFLKGLNTVLSLFSETTVSGRLLKQIIESMLNPLFGGSEAAGVAVKHLIQDMIYWVLEAQGYWLDLQIWVAKTFNYKGDLGLLVVMTALKGVLVAAAIAAVILGVAITTGILLALNALRVAATVVVIGLTALAAAVAHFAAPFVGAAAVIYGAWHALKSLYTLVTTMVDEGKSWGEIGKAIVSGIAEGITGSAGLVWKAIKNLASGTVSLLKSVLGIHSPSVVFQTQARFIPAGMALGIRQGASEVHEATREMVSIPAQPAYQAPSSSYGGREQSTPAPVTNNWIFQIDGSKGAEATADAIKRAVENIIMGMLAQAGAK